MGTKTEDKKYTDRGVVEARYNATHNPALKTLLNGMHEFRQELCLTSIFKEADRAVLCFICNEVEGNYTNPHIKKGKLTLCYSCNQEVDDGVASIKAEEALQKKWIALLGALHTESIKDKKPTTFYCLHLSGLGIKHTQTHLGEDLSVTIYRDTIRSGGRSYPIGHAIRISTNSLGIKATGLRKDFNDVVPEKLHKKVCELLGRLKAQIHLRHEKASKTTSVAALVYKAFGAHTQVRREMKPSRPGHKWIETGQFAFTHGAVHVATRDGQFFAIRGLNMNKMLNAAQVKTLNDFLNRLEDN